jgi:outer membrane lipoprotein SlyB
MRKTSLKFALLAACIIPLAACEATPSNVYSSSRTMQMNTVLNGRIIDVREVETRNIPQGDAMLGAAIGGAAGAYVGDQFGKGAGNVIMTGAGALGGAVAGSKIAMGVNRKATYEWFVLLDNGQTISVIQDPDGRLKVGVAVRVIQDGTFTRLAA